MEQALPSPSDGRHARSRRCQLALDLTVRGTGYHHPPPHSPGDCNVVGVVSFFVSSLLLLWKKLFQWICDSSLSFSWQKGDRPDNDLSLSHAASRQKKNSGWTCGGQRESLSRWSEASSARVTRPLSNCCWDALRQLRSTLGVAWWTRNVYRHVCPSSRGRQVISLQFTRSQQDVPKRRRKKRKQVDDGAAIV